MNEKVETLRIVINKGDDVGEETSSRVTSAIFARCIQFADEKPQEPEDYCFLTAKVDFEIIVRMKRKNNADKKRK